VVVLLAYATSQLVTGPVRRDDLLGWDAMWYRDIAEEGYQALPVEARRFFPALPTLVRMAAGVPGIDAGWTLIVLVNLAAVAFAFLAHRLALQWGMSAAAAQRVPWVIAFCPAAFVLAMGYTEAWFGVALCVVLLAAPKHRWALVIVAGLFGGLLRPTGVVLMLPIAIEAARGIVLVDRRELLTRIAAVASPAIGLLTYLAWSWAAFGDPWDPLTTQADPSLRGGFLFNPITSISNGLDAVAPGHIRQMAPLLHLLWIGLAAVLLVVGRRLLPAPAVAFSLAMLLLGVTARGFTSFERYAASAVPLLLVAATLLTTPRRRQVAATMAVLALWGYSFGAFLHAYVP
jgi:hypothetical protein